MAPSVATSNGSTVVPGAAVDQRLTVAAKGARQPEQAGPGASGEHATGSVDVSKAVARDTVVGEHDAVEPLTAHGLDGVTPQFADPHPTLPPNGGI
jgi:hypothetical protein